MGGNDTINSFEKKWCEWNINDTIEWFEFVLNSQNVEMDENENDDYEIEDCDSSSNSGDSSSSNKNENARDDEKQNVDINAKVDFCNVESCLFSMKFNAKTDLPISIKSFQFERFGFKIKNKKNNKEKKNKNNNDYSLEGVVQDTN